MYVNFVRSCKAHGFKAQIIDAAYVQDLVNMEAVFELVPGRKSGTGPDRGDFVVSEITLYPYEKKSSKPAASAAPKAASKANGVAKPAAAPVHTAADSPELDQDELKMECITALSETFAELKGAASRTKIASGAMTKIMAAHPPKSENSQTTVRAALKIMQDKNWFEENVIMMGGVNAGDDKYQAAG